VIGWLKNKGINYRYEIDQRVFHHHPKVITSHTPKANKNDLAALAHNSSLQRLLSRRLVRLEPHHLNEPTV
jgi:hypothetical protein